MRIAQLWQYPVKSMIGQQVDEVRLDPSGVADDRTWATRDLRRGGIRGAKQLGALMTFAARPDPSSPGDVVVTCPDGTSFSTSDPDRDARLSAALGHPVRLEALRPADDLDHYRRGAPSSDDVLTELRAVFGREADEPLPDFSVFPPEIVEFESPPGTYHDAYPLLLMTTSALRALAAALPGSVADVRRFRPSIVVDTPDEPGHPELGWTGATATLGDAEIELLAPCPRCVMVTRHIDDSVPEDRAILRHVVRDLGQHVGVYARVRRPGRVAVGDALSLRPPA